MVLDKFTYAGNPANLPEGSRLPPRRHRGPTRTSTRSARLDAIVNFAAETHVDRSILGPEDFVRTDVLGTLVLLQAAERAERPVRPGLHRRGLRRRRAGLVVTRGRPARARRARTARPRRAATCRCWRRFGRSASTRRSRAARTPTARTSIRRRCCRSSSRTPSTDEPLPLYGDGRQVRDWLHVDDHCAAIELVLRQGEAGEVYNVGAREEHENVELTRLIVEHLGADNRTRPPRRGPRRPRPALLARHDEDPLTRLAAAAQLG